jgi:hypothetical protein
MSTPAATPKPEAAPPRKQAVAICWFRREDYDAAKAEMSDPERLYEDYDEWLQEAQAFETEMLGNGIKTVRIRWDPTGFALFCLTRNIAPDGGARAEWAAFEANKRVNQKK